MFVLLPHHSPMDVSIAIETLSEANQSGAVPAYAWRLVSETGEPVTSQNGLELAVQGGLDPVDRADTIILCGGNRLGPPAGSALLHWLRKAATHGALIGALGSASAVLAQAGLAQDHAIAAHWATSDALREQYSDAQVSEAVYQLDDRRMTCAGGMATLDVFVALVSRQAGLVRAQDTAAALACSHLRDPQSPQVFSVSCRQLERLFSKYLGMPPKSFNDNLRLDHARRLLLQTQMVVVDVAVACGFKNPSHFSKLYRRRFGVRPSEERGVVSA